MRYNKWRALGSVSDPYNALNKWWLITLFHFKAKEALPSPQALDLLLLPFSYRLLCLTLAEEDNGLYFQAEEGTLEFWLPGLFLNHLPKSGSHVFRKGKRWAAKEGRAAGSVARMPPVLGPEGPAWLSLLWVRALSFLQPEVGRGCWALRRCVEGARTWVSSLFMHGWL